jgi:hypothetical protein
MSHWEDVDGELVEQWPNSCPSRQLPSTVPFHLILVTHDESIFYANDQRKKLWQRVNDKAVLRPKGEGTSIMVSDFLTPNYGRLMLEDGSKSVVLHSLIR